ncbi:hypothetical protein Tco_0861041 [Tanacetum coccineum]|uniref:Uncharacterized protein n=1 Tax=Tanacetum coccineum TaxID=301880 RepID=A0ABQ5BIC7_9ASTR
MAPPVSSSETTPHNLEKLKLSFIEEIHSNLGTSLPFKLVTTEYADAAAEAIALARAAVKVADWLDSHRKYI